jgi:hypothetical protein
MKKLSKKDSATIEKLKKEIIKSTAMFGMMNLYLAIEKKRESHNFKDATALLNPKIISSSEMKELDAAELDKFELLIKLAENSKRTLELQLKLKQAELHAKEMGLLFSGKK